MPAQGLPARLHFEDSSEHWNLIRSAWQRPDSQRPGTVEEFLARVSTYCKKLRSNALQLSGKFPRVKFEQFLKSAEFSLAVQLLLDTHDKLVSLESRGGLVMLDAMEAGDGFEVRVSKCVMSYEQVLCIVCNLLFCTLFESDDCWAYPSLAGHTLYTCAAAPRCVLGILNLLTRPSPLSTPLQVLRARAGPLLLDEQFKRNGEKLLPAIYWSPAQDSDCPRTVFADSFLGGGVIGHGRGQEEDLMRDRPATLAAMLVCMRMRDSEAIVISGHDYVSETKRLRAPPYIFIDAMPFHLDEGADQYSEHFLRRELLKAVTGFMAAGCSNHVATAAWGCGTFGGDMTLKFLLQWLACGLAGKKPCAGRWIFARTLWTARPDRSPKL